MKALKLLLLLLPLNLSAQSFKVVDLQTNDILFNPYDNKIYATVPSYSGVYGNSICIIDPITTQIDTAIFIGSEPYKLKLSDSGNIIYVALDGAAAIRQYNVSTRTIGEQISLGSDSISGPLFVQDIEFLKGSDNSVAISRRNKAFNPIHEGVGIYDSGVIRPKTTSRPYASNVIEVISNNLIVGYNNTSSSHSLQMLKFNGIGVYENIEYDNIINSSGADIYYSNGRIYSTKGTVVDVMSGTPTLMATFYEASGPLVVDNSLNLICFASKIGSKVAIKRYSLNTYVISDTIISNNVIPGNVLSLISWGDNGKLALNTSGGKIVIIDHPTNEIKESKITINFTAFPNPTVDYVKISVQHPVGSSKIQLFSLTGKLLKEETITSYPHEIDLTNHIPGNYLLRLQTDEISVVHKIIKL